MLEGFAVQDFINQSEHDGSIAVESPYNSDQCKDDTIDFNKVMVAHRFSAELLRSKSILRISHQKEHLFRVSGRVMRLLAQFMPKGMAIPS